MEVVAAEVAAGPRRLTKSPRGFLPRIGLKTALRAVSPLVASDELGDSYAVVRVLLSAWTAEAPISDDAVDRFLLLCRKVRDSQLWAGLADEAEYHGVAPLLETMISALAVADPGVVPDYVRLQFAVLAARHRRFAAVREKCIDQLLAAFTAAGITNVLLKGAALAHLIYPAPGLRPAVDIDVLVDPADAERAIGIVRDLGYAFASRHGSRFSGRMHHFPAARTTQDGVNVSLELHLDAMSPNQPESLTFKTLSAEPRPFRRGVGPRGLAFGHADMLRHLARHAFEPARRVHLQILHDLWRYQKIFAHEIDWGDLERRFPQVIIALQLVSQVFAGPQSATSFGAAPGRAPVGAGTGMVPLSEIAAMPFRARLAALFNPSPWWLHGFYGISPGRSLLVCRTVRHPLTLARWLAKRAAAATSSPVQLPIKAAETVLRR